MCIMPLLIWSFVLIPKAALDFRSTFSLARILTMFGLSFRKIIFCPFGIYAPNIQSP